MSLSDCHNAEPHGRETSTQMDFDRGRRSITSPVFHQSKSGSAPQGHTKESLKERFTTADNRVSQLLAVFDYDSGRLSSDIRLLRYSSHYRQNIVLYGSGRSTEINGGNVTQFQLRLSRNYSNSNCTTTQSNVVMHRNLRCLTMCHRRLCRHGV